MGRIRRLITLGTGAAVVALFAVGAATGIWAQQADTPGRQLYLTNCASCHGTSLEGQPDWMVRKPNGRIPAPPHDATGHTWHHSDEQLFRLTKEGLAAIAPGYETDMTAFARVCQLWHAVGSRIVVSRPDRHDRLTAIISHLPHLAAVALVRAVENFNEDKNLIRGIIGNGFRDTTRIAAGNSEMWEDICIDNQTEISTARTGLENALRELMEACAAEPGCERLHTMLEEARTFREFLDVKKD